jgi:hypothetical protein
MSPVVCVYAHTCILKWKLICVWMNSAPPTSVSLHVIEFHVESRSLYPMCFKMYVSGEYCKSRFGICICCKWLYMYVVIVQFHLFQMYITSVFIPCCICCNGCTRMLQLHVFNISSVLNVCCKCFIWCCICCSSYTRMLQLYVSHISSVHTYATSVLSSISYVVVVYVLNVSAISEICCKYFM